MPMVSRSALVALTAAALSAVPGPLAPPISAQAPQRAAGPEAVVVRADSLLYHDGEARASLALLEQALGAGGGPDDPVSYGLLWRAARAATAYGLVQEGQEREVRRDSLFRAAVAFGDRAVALRPEGVEGLYWRLAARGLLSLHADARSAVELTGRIDEESRAVLLLDSLHAGAHNALGRLNLEVMILPGWKRMIGRMLGGGLDGTNWALAEYHLQRALELEPGNALYLRDLGALHFHRGRPTAARVLLERLVARSGLLPWERVFQDEARRMLDELDGG